MTPLIPVLLTLAMVVLVPLAVLDPPADRRARAALLLAGAVGALSLAPGPGVVATLLAAVWAVATVVLLLAVLARHRHVRARAGARTLVEVGSRGWLVAGAVVLALHRGGLTLPDVDARLTLLTAVHFHYAGLVAPLIALWAADRQRAPSWQRAGCLVASGLVVAPSVVAAGFVLVPVLQVVGAVLETLGLAGVAVLLWRAATGLPRGWTRSLLTAAALSAPTAMALAVVWAVGHVWGTPAPSIPVMAATHGVLNAVGFGLCGLLGLKRAVPRGW